MKTSEETKAKFPIGARVRTEDRSHRLRGQRERFATVRGYCDQSGDVAYIRVTWDEWKPASTVAVDSTTFEVVSEPKTDTKHYLLIEVNSKDEAVQDLRQAVEDMLQPGDGRDIHVRVFELEDIGFEGRMGSDIHRDTQILNGPRVLSVSANLRR